MLLAMKYVILILLLLHAACTYCQSADSTDKPAEIYWLSDNYRGNLLLYKTYYNKYYPLCKGVSFKNLNVKAKGFKIIKSTDGFFYIRLINNQEHAHSLNVFDGKKLITTCPIVIENNIPLPTCIPVYIERLGPLGRYYFKCDSLYLTSTYRFTDSNNTINVNFKSEFDCSFKIRSFTATVYCGDQIIYAERHKGYKYSNKFLSFIRNNYQHRYFFIKPEGAFHTLEISDIIIQDDLGNQYTTLSEIVFLRPNGVFYDY